METKKAWALTIRIKKNDRLGGRPLERALVELLEQAGISGATVWTGVDGFGRRGRSTVQLEGLTVNMPMMIEAVDEKSKLEPLLLQIKQMVGDNGLVTLHEVEIIV
jgi:uncharacterized protein